jgi:isopenicillin N synthase-like dioxygenase
MLSHISELIPPFPENVPIADISTVDFSVLAADDEASAQAVYDAARGYGFFYVKNHAIDSDFMFDLANSVFKLPHEEKMKYGMGSPGGYFGYKRSGSQYVDDKGTPDHSEFYNVSKDDILRVGSKEPLRHPEPINERRAELESFMRSCHHLITVIASVLGEQLGLRPDVLPALHWINRTGGEQARVTHAPPVGSDVITLGEHTDIGTVAVLFNQLGVLQVLNPNSREWKYVKPLPACAIINLGDAIVKLVGERLYNGVHRVVGPPSEQARCPRHSVVYFRVQMEM